MQIWVDADACPRVIKDFSAAPSCSAEKPGAYVLYARSPLRGLPCFAPPNGSVLR